MKDVVTVTFLSRVMNALTAGVDSTVIYVLVSVERPKYSLVLRKPRSVSLLPFLLLWVFFNEVVTDLDELLFDRKTVGLPGLGL